MTQYLVPNTADRETRGFFEAAAQGQLVYRACNSCNHALHPPTGYCRHCGGWDTAWRPAKGTGTLHSWTTVVHQVHPSYPTPYTIVVVTLDDTREVRLVGRLDGQPALQAGMPMEVWFETLPNGAVLPQWKVK
jgi:uncharacterized OB-fold protein